MAVLFGVASRYIGRLGMLRVSCVLCAVALFSQIFATNHGAIYAGRLILGGHVSDIVHRASLVMRGR